MPCRNPTLGCLRLQCLTSLCVQAVDLYKQGRNEALSANQVASLQRLRQVQETCETHTARLSTLLALMSEGQ